MSKRAKLDDDPRKERFNLDTRKMEIYDRREQKDIEHRKVSLDDRKERLNLMVVLVKKVGEPHASTIGS